MAFDHPLEADKVDDLGLFSTLVRAPVVGIIMWALGGHDAKKREEEDQKRFVKEQLEGECPISSEERPIYTAELQKMIEQNRNKKMGKKMPPRMIGSDLSDFGDLSIHPSETDYEEKENDSQMGSNRLKRAKKMSWSDESGQSLCEYLDESVVTHEPQHTASSSSVVGNQPMKSAMKRSRSTRKEPGALNKVGTDQTLRYVPKGLSAVNGGIIYPTHPNAHGAPGYASPEGWGWYITTTPPTPDMYQSYSSNKQPKKSVSHSSASATRTGTLTNPAFKTGPPNSAIGWPSVPL